MGASRALLLAALLVVSIAAPAQAKCCPLDHLVIKRSGGDGQIWIEGRDLEERLPDWALGLLSSPIFNGTAKGNVRPEGRLGRAYDVIYVHESLDEGRFVRARERLYPSAEGGPVAFTLPGQTQEFYRGDERRIPAGRRPVEGETIRAMFGADVWRSRGLSPPPPPGFKFDFTVVALLATAFAIVALLVVALRRRTFAPRA